MNAIFNKINMGPLIKLRDYFKTLPSDYGKFDMKGYALDSSNDNLYPQDVPECGTSMCILGHLPLVGYPGLEVDDWEDYCIRVLNLDYSGSKEEDAVWEYLFSCRWSSDIQLAVQRLDDVINIRMSSLAADSVDETFGAIENYNALFD